MGSMMRSEEMVLCQLLLQPEAAYPSIAALGEMGVAQFRDMNPDVSIFQKKFIAEVKRCEEMDRRINYIYRELRKDEVKITECFAHEIPRTPNSREIIDLEALLEKTENEILELSENNNALHQNFMELNELKHVLEKSQGFFADKASNLEAMANAESGNEGKPLGFVAGVIQREKVIGFERMLWRVSRGNVFLRQTPIETPFTDPRTGDMLHKIVFVAFFQGEQLKSRVRKICSGYHASLYPCPNTFEERRDMLMGVNTRIADLETVLNQTKYQRQLVLFNVAKDLSKWTAVVKKIKAIYHTLNFFNVDVSKKCYFGECWVPTNDLHLVQRALVEGSEVSGSTVPSFLNVISTKETPPTFNRLNKFTQGFQSLIDSYGVSSYREVNPAFYTIITFPFLFAIMFGDLGHGIILLLTALYLVLNETKFEGKKKGEIFNIFFGGRYIILLMGAFSCFTGLIYNDIFSKTMNIFGSSWTITYNETTIMSNKELQLNPSEMYSETVYWLGVDPVWMLASNKIIFLNSFKMKMSIIFGVIHMIFGLCMSVVNHIYFKKPIYILLEFVPQLLFILVLFGYMVFMMFFKWIVYNAVTEDISLNPGCAPSILILFINMMLFGSNEQEDKNCLEYMFTAQPNIQMVFVAIAFICIPWLLLAKPLYIMATRPKGGQPSDEGGHGHGHENEPMGEVFIQQAIHTIEYILSTISHTASYLRLWALSLAHAQLSEVLWQMIFSMGLKQKDPIMGPIMIYLMFYVWSALTISILVGMEGLSAFLHTLRLHWVEFMTKFYEGLGYAFEPFCFKTILSAEDEDKQ